MQTGTISFCDKQSLNIKSNDTKKVFNDKLNDYGIKILQKHFERFDDNSFNKLKSNPYIASLKSNGNPYIMFLTRFNETDICLMIDKKIQQGYFLPRMIIDNVCFNSRLFDDTIFEGEMIKTNSGEWIFMMNDIRALEGKNLDNMNILKRIQLINGIVTNKYKPLPDQKFHVQVKKYFKVDEIDELMSLKETLDYTSRGVIFKPMFPKFRDILFNFDDSLISNTRKIKFSEENKFIDNIDNNNNNINSNSNMIHTVNTNMNANTNINVKDTEPDTSTSIINNKVFSVEKTDKPDVYNLYDDSKHIGIACVPTLKVSKFLRQTFENVNLMEKVKMDCEYNGNFTNKWIPISKH